MPFFPLFWNPFFENNNRNCHCGPTATRNFATTFVPSAIELNNQTEQTVNAGDEVDFAQSNLNTGVSFTYTAGNNFFEIVSNGVYAINFSANLTSQDATTANFAIAVDDTANLTSQIVQTISAQASENVKTQLFIKVTYVPVKISVLNNGNTAVNVTYANLSAVKIGEF